jgi:hypothetical protein
MISRSDLAFCQLAKHHRHKLAPAAEALGSPFGFVLSDQAFKPMPVHYRKHLAKETGVPYHVPDLR